MLLGHVAVALAARPVALRTPTAVLLGAALFVDFLWPLFLLLGLEHVQINPGNTAYTPLAFTHYPITHSLLGGVAWAALAGGLYYALSRYRRGALVVAALVVSHWVLDWVVHRPDLPLYPGSTKYGLGLWHSVAGTVLLEAAMLIAGAALYLRATRALGPRGVLAFRLPIAVLVMVVVGTIIGPPPPDETSLAVAALLLWAVPLWGIWIDRHRAPVSA